MNQSISIIVKGQVQGVGYRYHTLKNANELKINGFVKNQSDGSVNIIAEGETEAIGAFIERCKQGPRFARVSSVEVYPVESNNYIGFEIK
jgi:acylphosphatase